MAWLAREWAMVRLVEQTGHAPRPAGRQGYWAAQHGVPYQAHPALLVMAVKQAEQPTMEMTCLNLA